jgi:hypothetical protein
MSDDLFPPVDPVLSPSVLKEQMILLEEDHNKNANACWRGCGDFVLCLFGLSFLPNFCILAYLHTQFTFDWMLISVPSITSLAQVITAGLVFRLFTFVGFMVASLFRSFWPRRLVFLLCEVFIAFSFVVSIFCSTTIISRTFNFSDGTGCLELFDDIYSSLSYMPDRVRRGFARYISSSSCDSYYYNYYDYYYYLPDSFSFYYYSDSWSCWRYELEDWQDSFCGVVPIIHLIFLLLESATFVIYLPFHACDGARKLARVQNIEAGEEKVKPQTVTPKVDWEAVKKQQQQPPPAQGVQWYPQPNAPWQSINQYQHQNWSQQQPQANWQQQNQYAGGQYPQQPANWQQLQQMAPGGGPPPVGKV